MAGDLDAAYAHSGTVLREQDRDLYFADLFAPLPQRRHLFALHAFCAEVARIRDLVSAPMPGEIRLQWWRDALSGEARGDVAGHPLATALLDTVERFALPRQALIDLLDARVFDLYDDAMPTLGDLEGYLAETCAAPIRLASLILAEGHDPGFADAAGHAGLACGLTDLIRALPWHTRQGRLYVPVEILARHQVAREAIMAPETGPGLGRAVADLCAEAERHLGEARRLLVGLPKPLRPAFLPLALVPARLAAIRRRGSPLSPDRPDTPIAVLWRLWRANRRGLG